LLTSIFDQFSSVGIIWNSTCGKNMEETQQNSRRHHWTRDQNKRLHNCPDIVYIDFVHKHCYLIDIAIPGDSRISEFQ